MLESNIFWVHKFDFFRVTAYNEEGWAGNVTYMGQIWNAYKIFIGNPEWMRPLWDERTDKRIMLILIVKKQDMEPVDWLRIVARSFKKRQWTFGLRNTWAFPWTPEKLPASEKITLLHRGEETVVSAHWNCRHAGQWSSPDSLLVEKFWTWNMRTDKRTRRPHTAFISYTILRPNMWNFKFSRQLVWIW
jgi:hypothetical protein